MTSIAQVLRKDLRLGRLGIAAWLVVLAAEVVFTLSGLDARPLESGGPWIGGATTLTFAHLALLFVVLVGAVQADAPTSPTAFWPTRPLSRWHVLGAKLTFAVVVVALPWLLANTLILIGRGIALGDVVRNLPDVVLVQAVVILPVLVLGALTTQLARAVVALVALVAFNSGVSWMMYVGGLQALTQAAFEPGRGPAADAVGGLIVLLLAAAALAATYRRRPWRATALAVVGGPLALAVLWLWPWSFSRTPRPTLPAAVTLTAGDAQRTGTAWVRPQRSTHWSKWPVAGEALASGVPDGLRAWPTRVESDVRWQQGPDEPVVIEPRSVDARPDTSASIAVAGLGRVTAQSPPRTAWLAGFDPETMEGRSPASVTTITRVRLALVRERLAARLPLRAGARWDGPSQHVVVMAASVDDTVVVDVVESGYRRREVPPQGTETGLSVGGFDRIGTSYWAVYNGSRRELLRLGPGYATSLSIPAAAAGLQIGHCRLELTWPRGERWRDRALRRAWLRDAELVTIRTDLVAEGERTLEVKDLPVPDRVD